MKSLEEKHKKDEETKNHLKTSHKIFMKTQRIANIRLGRAGAATGRQ